MKTRYPYGTKLRGLLLFFFHFTYALDFLYFHKNSAKERLVRSACPYATHTHISRGFLVPTMRSISRKLSIHLLSTPSSPQLCRFLFFFLELIFSDKFLFLLILLLKHIYQFLCFFLTCHPRLFYFTIIQTSLLTRPIHLHL